MGEQRFEWVSFIGGGAGNNTKHLQEVVVSDTHIARSNEPPLEIHGLTSISLKLRKGTSDPFHFGTRLLTLRLESAENRIDLLGSLSSEAHTNGYLEALTAVLLKIRSVSPSLALSERRVISNDLMTGIGATIFFVPAAVGLAALLEVPLVTEAENLQVQIGPFWIAVLFLISAGLLWKILRPRRRPLPLDDVIEFLDRHIPRQDSEFDDYRPVLIWNA